MDNEQREAHYLAKAKEAQEKSDLAIEYSLKAAWRRISEDYRTLARVTRMRGYQSCRAKDGWPRVMMAQLG